MNLTFTKKYLPVSAFSIIVIIICLAGCSNGRKYNKEGELYLSEGNWDKSVQYYQDGLNKYPDNTEIKLRLKRSKLEASLSHMAKGISYHKQNRFNEAISEFQLSIAFNPSNNHAGILIERAKKKKTAAHFTKRGRIFLKAQKYYQAREAFKKAIKLDADNETARKYLSYFKKKRSQTSSFKLEYELKSPVSFKFKKTSIINVFEVLSKLSGINFIFDKDVTESTVTLFMEDVPFERFIEVLLKTSALSAKQINEKTMMIYPDTPSKANEYRDLKIRTFYLSDLEAKKSVSLLSKILKNNKIIANEKFNAVVMRGGDEEIDIASRILSAHDLPQPEVLLNVEILEVSRTKEKQLGLEINPASVTFGLGETSEVINSDSAFTSISSVFALEEISNKERMLSIPTATLHFLKQDGDTKVLANPQIRAKNREKAMIHIGERIPLRTNRRVDTTGNVTYDYQYQDIGVKLDVLPIINMHGEITLKLNLEISSLGPNVASTDDPQHSIRTKKAKSVLAVLDGEPVIIGGLISDEERETIRKVPLLGDIPILGYLFTKIGSDGIKSDILMSITPYVLRGQEIPNEDVTQIWSGYEKNFLQREPYESLLKQQKMYLDYPADTYFKDLEEKPMEMDTRESDEEDQSSEMLPKNDNLSSIDHPLIAAPETYTEPDRNEPLAESLIERRIAENTDYHWPVSNPYSIHIGSFPRKDQAMKRIQELKGLNYECFLAHVNIKGKGLFYRVFVGQFQGYVSARAVCKDFKSRGEFEKDIHVVTRRWAFDG